MINENNSNDSASNFKNKDLDFYQNNIEQNQQKCSEIESLNAHSKTPQTETFFNPFNQKSRNSLSFEDQFRFSKKQQKLDQSKKINRQSNPFSKPQDEKVRFSFGKKSKQFNEKQSLDFMFKGDLSGSLFSSNKSQKEVEKVKKSKNLQNFMGLLNQYYNDSYLMNRIQIFRKTVSPTSHLSIRRSDIPFFITREPILFQKKCYGIRSGYDLSGNFLCKLIGNKIYYKNVINEELQTSEQLKCECIELSKNESASPSLEIDASSLHLFYYSNTTYEIVVLSLSKNRKNNFEICRIKTRTQRINPLLYLIQINKQTILLLIGGYSRIHAKKRPQEVEGCKYIEIFPVDKWGTCIIESRVIKLINGKIYPLIIFPVKIELNDSILLIGGNTMAKIVGDHLSFKQYKVVNRSSNVRGVYINTKNIIECIEQNKDIMSLANGNNISVQIQDKVSLYNGYVDYIRTNYRQKIRLFLPKMTQFYTIKILKKEVRIIKSKQSQQRLLTFEQSECYQHLEMKCFRKPTTKYYEITNKGFFQQKVISLSSSDPFGLRNQWRCPCEFM